MRERAQSSPTLGRNHFSKRLTGKVTAHDPFVARANADHPGIHHNMAHERVIPRRSAWTDEHFKFSGSPDPALPLHTLDLNGKRMFQSVAEGEPIISTLNTRGANSATIHAPKPTRFSDYQERPAVDEFIEREAAQAIARRHQPKLEGAAPHGSAAAHTNGPKWSGAAFTASSSNRSRPRPLVRPSGLGSGDGSGAGSIRSSESIARSEVQQQQQQQQLQLQAQRPSCSPSEPAGVGLARRAPPSDARAPRQPALGGARGSTARVSRPQQSPTQRGRHTDKATVSDVSASPRRRPQSARVRTGGFSQKPRG